MKNDKFKKKFTKRLKKALIVVIFCTKINEIHIMYDIGLVSLE
jgi:hypothetical protein